MTCKAVLALGIFAASTTSLATANPAASAYSFLTTHIENRAFNSEEMTFTIEPDRLIGVSSAQRIFKNVTMKDTSLSFNIINIKKQTNFRLTDTGERMMPGKNEDAVITRRCILSERRSTGRFLGICFSEDSPGYETSAEIILGDAEGVPLTLIEETANGHVDGYAATESGFKPAFIKTITAMLPSEDRVEFAHTETGFDVDITTGDVSVQPYATVERRYTYSK